MKSHLLGAVCAFCISITSHASLIDHGKYIEDDATSLYWLKLSETAGLSYNEVQTLKGAGGMLEGWGYATWNQTRDFYKTNFGLDLEGADFSPTAQELAKITLLNSYMGDLMLDRGDTGEFSGSTALVSDRSEIQTYYYNYGANMRDTTGLTRFPDYARSYMGSVLFRTDAPPIPIPPALYLFGSGLIGLVGMARRKKA